MFLMEESTVTCVSKRYQKSMQMLNFLHGGLVPGDVATQTKTIAATLFDIIPSRNLLGKERIQSNLACVLPRPPQPPRPLQRQPPRVLSRPPQPPRPLQRQQPRVLSPPPQPPRPLQRQ